jgi:hypothetical protein
MGGMKWLQGEATKRLVCTKCAIGCDWVQFAASRCNWLQVFHTKATKETKRRAEVESQARPQTGCNSLQVAARRSHEKAQNAQNARFSATWTKSGLTRRSAPPGATGCNLLQLAASSRKWFDRVLKHMKSRECVKITHAGDETVQFAASRCNWLQAGVAEMRQKETK